ncbi:MAG: GMC family oxidoreductase [Myxococcales bacterium]|nr:GMC family oxidoreductase [Myxococcales bacterium]
MSHVAFQPDGQDVELEVDYVVVGSGAGGSTSAVTLARGGEEVAVVEAGPWRDPHDYPISTYGAMRDMMDDWGATLARGRAFWPVVQARLVGGTTVINSAICVRTPGDIFRQWRRERGVGGDWYAERVWKAQDQIERDLCVEEVPRESLGRSNELAVEGDRAAGMGGYVMRRYVKGCLGTGQCLQGCRALRKQSTNLNYLPEVLRRGGHILSCAPVDRVRFDGHRAIGVEGSFESPDPLAKRKGGARFFVRARKGVLVAASVTHSPRLLRRSGVRNRNLGAGFRAHPGTGVLGCYDDPVDMNTGATQGWASTAFRDEPGLKLETLSLPLELVASRLSGGGHQLMARLGEFRHLAMWVQATRAESVGRISTVLGKPNVKYSLDRADMLRFRAGMTLVAKMHFAAGAKAIIPGVHGMPYKLTADQLSLMESAPLDPRAYVAIMSHLFGGCMMGRDPRESVCDGDGRVHGYEGLYVSDASSIPTNLGVNPQHTIMGMAQVLAERLLDRG